jgi:hypothetical protein
MFGSGGVNNQGAVTDRCQSLFTQGKSRQEAYDALFEEFKDELDAGLLRRNRITDILAKSYGRTRKNNVRASIGMAMLVHGVPEGPQPPPEVTAPPQRPASSTDPQPTEEEVPRPSAATRTVPLKRLHFAPEAYAKPSKKLGSLCSLGCCIVRSQWKCIRCVNKRCPVRVTSYPYAGSDRTP